MTLEQYANEQADKKVDNKKIQLEFVKDGVKETGFIYNDEIQNHPELLKLNKGDHINCIIVSKKNTNENAYQLRLAPQSR